MTTKPRKPSEEAARKIIADLRDRSLDDFFGNLDDDIFEEIVEEMTRRIDRLCARVRRDAEVEGVWTRAATYEETTDWNVAYGWSKRGWIVDYSLRPKRRKGRANGNV